MKKLIILSLILLNTALYAGGCLSNEIVILNLFPKDSTAASYAKDVCITSNGVTKRCGNNSFRCAGLLKHWKITLNKLPVEFKSDESCQSFLHYSPFSARYITADISWDSKNKYLHLYNCQKIFSYEEE